MSLRRKPGLAVIFVTVLIDLIGFGIIIPALPLFAASFGVSGKSIAFLFASYSLMQFIFAPIWGRLSDRIGRRPILLFSIAGNAIALFVFATAQSFLWLLLARIVAGICTANVSAASAYVADITPPEERSKGMGILGAAFGVGFVVGPFIGGEMGRFGFAAPALFAGGLATLNFFQALFFLPESLKHKSPPVVAEGFVGRLRVVRSVPGAGPLLGLAFLQITAFSMLEMAFVLFANHRFGFGPVQSGRVFGYIGVILAVVQGFLIGPLVKRFGEKRLILIGLACVATGMGTIPFSPVNVWLFFVVCATLVAIGQGCANPAASGLLSKKTAVHLQGMVMGVSQSLGALARVVGPQTAGTLLDSFGDNVPFWVGASVMVCAWLWAIVAVHD